MSWQQAALEAEPHVKSDRPARPVSCTAWWQKSARACAVGARAFTADRSCRGGVRRDRRLQQRRSLNE